MVVNLSSLLSRYKKGWVALSPDHKRVIASGDSLRDALQKAKAKGTKNPSLLKIAPWNKLFVGLLR